MFKSLPMRTKYMLKFYFRCGVFVITCIAYIFYRKSLSILDGMNFFHGFSPWHLLWGIWMVDMILQLIPARGVLTLGSQKQFLMHFKPSQLSKTKGELEEFLRESNYAGLKVAVIWLAACVIIGIVRITGLIHVHYAMFFMVLFYLCDLICVLFWCPFRVWLMKNRCCATCRIFNWDHTMMFLPGIFCVGFFTWSLFLMSLVVLLVWEIDFFQHPERFWDETNDSLKCANCTEYMCGKNIHGRGI